MLPLPLRLVVDLNIWIKDFRADLAGERRTAAQVIVEAAMDGRCVFGPIELVMSHTMLSRLEEVLSRKIAEAQARTASGKPKAGDAWMSLRTPDSVASYIDNIRMAMEIGPHIVLGGGVLPTADTFRDLPNDRSPKGLLWSDPEDGRVIDTAVAAQAHAIATDNFADFAYYNDLVLVPNQVHIRGTAGHDVLIVSLDKMSHFLRRGIPLEMEEAILGILHQHTLPKAGT